MTHAHTPGPFPLHIQHDGERYAIITAQGNHFATTYDPSAARLIAAAPELLNACKKLVEYLGTLPDDTEKCRHLRMALNNRAGDLMLAAIAKAERGEA